MISFEIVISSHKDLTQDIHFSLPGLIFADKDKDFYDSGAT